VREVVSTALSDAKGLVAPVVTPSQVADEAQTVIGLIRAVASQTKMLALSETIEAVRAVVAAEVKGLAAQTAHRMGCVASQQSDPGDRRRHDRGACPKKRLVCEIRHRQPAPGDR